MEEEGPQIGKRRLKDEGRNDGGWGKNEEGWWTEETEARIERIRHGTKMKGNLRVKIFYGPIDVAYSASRKYISLSYQNILIYC